MLANEDLIFTCSVHCSKNFPFGFSNTVGLKHLGMDKSDLDIGLQPGIDDKEYLSVLKSRVIPIVLDEFQPDLVLYDAGVDVSLDDDLGNFNLTHDGIYKRDLLIMDACAKRGIPIACVIGGGYDKDRVKLAEKHAIVIQAAIDSWPKFNSNEFRKLRTERETKRKKGGQ